MELKTITTNSVETTSNINSAHQNDNVQDKRKQKRKSNGIRIQIDEATGNNETSIKKKRIIGEDASNYSLIKNSSYNLNEDNSTGKDSRQSKKQKLKFKESIQPAENNSIGPEKIETNLYVNKMKDENELHESSDEEDFPAAKVPSKEVNELTAKYLRTSFNSASGLNILRKFVHICTENTERDLASEYIEKSGNVLEILRLLESGEKKNLNNSALVFSGMHIVIMKILEKYPQNISAAQEACHHFINCHLSTVHAMMSNQSNTKQRKIVLRLLASIVSLGDSLPRELLAHLSFHQETLALLSQQTKPSDPQSVRTCFIHFILAFLVDSRNSVIKVLLDKRGLLACIFPDLVYDSHETVALILNTIKTYVLENSGISKTSKLHIFSTPVVQNLVSLYNWKGPRNWPGLKTKKGKNMLESVDLEDKKIAVEAVHDFLLVLLTSNRYGIIFNDKSLGTSGKKHNQLVNTILQSLDRPWEHEKPCELVSRVLSACPDLIRPQLVYTEPYLAPRPSKKWVAVMNFVRRIIGSIDIENCLKSSVSELTASQLINAILTLTMPLIVLKQAILPSMNASSIIQRHEAIRTLTIMLRQVKIFLNVAERSLTDSEYFNLQLIIRDNISKNIPTIEKILIAWNQVDEPANDMLSINMEEIELTPPKSESYSGILDLLQAYYDVHQPEYMKPDDVEDVKYRPDCLLTSLSHLEDVDEEKLNLMKVRAIQIIEIVDPTTFAPDEKFFARALQFLISLLDSSSDELKFAGKETIKMLLKTSNIFEKSEDQMNIWLNSFHLLGNSQERSRVAQWFLKLIPKVVKHAEKYQKLIREADKVEEEKASKNRSMELPSEKEDKMKLMQPRISIPLILCAAFESLAKNRDESIEKFVSIITVLTLHCQVSPIALINLSQNVKGLPVEYLNSWKKEGTPVKLEEVKILLSSDEDALKVLLRSETSPDAEYEILNFLKMTIFYLTQFIQRDEFSQEQFDGYKRVIIGLLDYSKNSELENKTECIFECTKYILTHPILLQYFSPIPKGKNEKHRIVTTELVEIINKIIEVNDECNLQKLLYPFRAKLISQLRTVLIKCSGSRWNLKNSQCLIEFIEILRLTSDDFQDILEMSVKLPKESLLTDDKKSLSMWSEMIPKLISLLSSRKIPRVLGKNSMKETQVIHKLCIYFTYLKLSGVNVERWENAFEEFFRTFPYYLSAFDMKTFSALLEKEINRSTIKLISLVCGRCAKFIPLVMKYIETQKSEMEHHDLIFSVLSSNLSYKWNAEFLNKIHEKYRDDIVNYLACSGEVKFWVSENSRAIEYIIESCFSLETCEKISTKILSSGDKLESVDLSYIKVLFSLFRKLSKFKENPRIVLMQLLQVLIRLIVSAFKKNATEEDKVLTLCEYISQTVANLKSMKNDFTFEELNKTYSWPQFTRFSLKLGLKKVKYEKKPPPLLRILWEVFDIAYVDECQDEYVKTLFAMTTSHSEFVNMMLSSVKLKNDLLQLLLIFLRKNPSVMMPTHIPLYLSAYNATLNECDQKILLILHYYETSGIKLSEYRPYLFGEAAAAHYSVRGEADTAIWRQPSTSQVLDLFHNDTVIRTIENFPVNRTMNLHKSQNSESVYDPAFYLPLLTHLLAHNNVVACSKVTQSGALALVFAACGSPCREIRMTAYTVLTRFYFHLDATSSKEKLLWMRIIDGLRNGITSLECPLVDARLNGFVSTFLAKSSLVATQPLNPLYSRVQMFFMAKPEFDLSIIPEFFTLFNSSEINHKIHRLWILEVVRDGMNTELDMEIAFKCSLFRTLFYFCGCNLADARSKILILQIIDATVKIPKAGSLLCREYGLLVWLEEVTNKLNFRHCENIELIVDIVRNLLNNVLESNDQDNHIQFALLEILKRLISKLSKHTSINSYLKLLSSLRDILQTKLCIELVTKKDVEYLIEVSKNVVGDVSDCTEFLIHSCEFVERDEIPEGRDEISLAKSNLRNIVIAWRS